MPDTNEPGYYYRAALERMKYKARDCEEKGRQLLTQAEVYREAASNIEDAIEREERKSAVSAPSAQEPK